MFFRNTDGPLPISVSLPNPVDSPVRKICFSQHSQNNNRNIRALFQREIVSILAVMSYLNRFVNDINWKKVWMIPHKYLILNKVKEVSFRISHKFYPANHYMVKFKRDINTNCSFFDHPETVLHLFWGCSHTKKSWQDFGRFIIDHVYRDFALMWEIVIFCFFRSQRKADKFFIINY